MTDQQLVVIAAVLAVLISGAFALSVAATWSAWKEREIARATGNGRWLFARGTFRAQVCRTIELAALGTITGAVLFQVPERRTVTVVLFLVITGGLVFETASDWMTTRRINRVFADKWAESQKGKTDGR
jgi:hypothetical protein